MFDAIIGGKLIKPPQFKATKSGAEFAVFTLRFNVLDNEGATESLLCNTILFGPDVEYLHGLDAGDSVSVTGACRLNKYEKDGTERTTLAMTASRLITPTMAKKTRQSHRQQRRGNHEDSQQHDYLSA